MELNIKTENTLFSPDVLSCIKKTTTLKASEIGIESLSSGYLSNILLPLTSYFSSIIENRSFEIQNEIVLTILVPN